MAEDNLFLKAGRDCIDIFEDFDEIEITTFPKSIQIAWTTGRELSAEIAEQKALNDSVDINMVY